MNSQQHFSVRFDDCPEPLDGIARDPIDGPRELDLPIVGLYLSTSILDAPSDLPREGDTITIDTPESIFQAVIREYDPETRILRVTLV